MPLLPFLRQLFDHGRVTVAEEAAISFELRELQAALQEFDQAYRRQLADEMPPLAMPAAMFGALVLYRSAQVLAFRNLGVEALTQAIQQGPVGLEAGEQTSVDLCLHFLPDLVRLARAASANDPLVTCLLDLGVRWPLSSVGVAGVTLGEQGTARVEALAAHPAAWRMYVDRVILTGDASRLADVVTRNAVRAAVGAFPQLAGKLETELVAHHRVDLG